MESADFPDNLVIELRKTPSVEFVAQSTHVTNIPVQAFEAPPVVVTTHGKGATPVAAVLDLLENIITGEAT